jgi:hypothetical protein
MEPVLELLGLSHAIGVVVDVAEHGPHDVPDRSSMSSA